MGRHAYIWAFAALLLLGGCPGAPSAGSDGGPVCAEPDVCGPDAGQGPDGGQGVVDAGQGLDAGQAGDDAGQGLDAGQGGDDAGVDGGSDAGGGVDAGERADGGASDAGGGSDAGDALEQVLYVQDFDSLPTSPTSSDIDVTVFTDALPGWALHNANDRRRAGHGSVSTAAIYSFGAPGSSERALGGVAGAATGTQRWGFCFTNTTGHRVIGLTLTYVGEQWRAANAVGANTLRFHYTRSPVVAADLPSHLAAAVTGDPATGWTSESALHFVSPVLSTAGAIDGDTSRSERAHTFSDLDLEDSQTACFRWEDVDDPGGDHGLAIDDLVLRGTRGPG